MSVDFLDPDESVASGGTEKEMSVSLESPANGNFAGARTGNDGD